MDDERLSGLTLDMVDDAINFLRSRNTDEEINRRREAFHRQLEAYRRGLRIYYNRTEDREKKKMEDELEKLAKVRIDRGDETTTFTILEQYKYCFTRDFVIDGKIFSIQSVNVVEYRGYDNKLFLKGDSDSYKDEAMLIIPTEEFDWFWETIKDLFIVEGDEEEEAVERNVDFSFNAEPTDEEIEKMISLVKIDTFTKIIKNRLYQEMPEEDRKHLEDYGRKWAKGYLKRWAKAKYRFYKFFGDKLTIEKEVEVKADENTTKQKWDEIIDEFPLLKYSLSQVPMRWIREDRLYNNGSYFFDAKEVNVGMSFTKFIALFSNKDLDIEVSKLYQDLGKTKLYLSIDPIDYLTVSINKSGWHSCHNFLEGCYKNAGLSYMFDECSFISFTSNKETTYAKYNMPFKWNSKNWRQMVYSAKNSSATIFSRQYPFDSEELSKNVREIYEGLLCDYFKCESKWKVFQNEENAGIDVYSYNDVENLYNDVKEGYNHKAVKNKLDIRYEDEIDIPIGSEYEAFNGDYNIYGGEDYLWYNEYECEDY